MDGKFSIVVSDPAGQASREGLVHVLHSLFPSASLLVALHGANRRELGAAAVKLPADVRPLISVGGQDEAVTAGYRAVLAIGEGGDVVRMDALRHPYDAVPRLRRLLEGADVSVLDMPGGDKEQERARAALLESSGGGLRLRGSFDMVAMRGGVLSGLLGGAGSGIDARLLSTAVRNELRVVSVPWDAPVPNGRPTWPSAKEHGRVKPSQPSSRAVVVSGPDLDPVEEPSWLEEPWSEEER